MKKFLILPIIIVIQVIGTSAFFDKCPQLVQQYYECQHLTMLPNNSSTTTSNTLPSWKKYVRDLSKSRNSLNESFYKQQLGKMNLSDALDLIWTIYISSRNCQKNIESSCKCLAFETFDEAKIIEDFFHHGKKSFYEQTKKVIVDFFSDYQIEKDLEFNKKNTALESFCNRYISPYYESIYTNKEIKLCMNETNRAVS